MAEKRFDVMTLFPELMENILSESIIGRARKSGILDINIYNIRDYSKDKFRRVDDTPYGGGKGMLLKPEPVCDCYDDIVKDAESKPYTVYMSPKGKVLTQDMAKELAKKDRIVILCGHYEGIDERALECIVDDEISIGDYVLTGGEIPCAALIDCVSRMVDGVLSDRECYEKESLSDNLLEYPQYTRPFEFRGKKVPEVLISGHHENIEKWRYEKALEITKARRPDLLEKGKEK